MKKIKLKIIDMHCTSCSIMIDGDLEDTQGVKSSSTNYAKALCEVEFDESILSLDQILETVRKSGYTAEAL